VYHPSGEMALPCYQIYIAARVLVFIKNYQDDIGTKEEVKPNFRTPLR
jgi:hypothetical protein